MRKCVREIQREGQDASRERSGHTCWQCPLPSPSSLWGVWHQTQWPQWPRQFLFVRRRLISQGPWRGLPFSTAPYTKLLMLYNSWSPTGIPNQWERTRHPWKNEQVSNSVLLRRENKHLLWRNGWQVIMGIPHRNTVVDYLGPEVGHNKYGNDREPALNQGFWGATQPDSVEN